MAKKKKVDAVEEGAVIELSEPEAVEAPEAEVEEIAQPASGSPEEERLMEEAAANLTAAPKAPEGNLHTDPPVEMQNPLSEDLVKIRFMHTGSLRCADGSKITKGETGDVLSHIADAVVGRGHAEVA